MKCLRCIPLKSHLYAALTADISRSVPALAQQIFEVAISGLETDLNQGQFTNALNTLNFLSESMNVLLFNSLTLVDLLSDLLTAVEKEADEATRQVALEVLMRSLPLCAHSLTEKVYHDFRKLMEKVKKIASGHSLCNYLYGQFQKSNLTSRSKMGGLGCDFAGLTQFQSKVKLQLDFSSAKEKHFPRVEYYKWEST